MKWVGYEQDIKLVVSSVPLCVRGNSHFLNWKVLNWKDRGDCATCYSYFWQVDPWHWAEANTRWNICTCFSCLCRICPVLFISFSHPLFFSFFHFLLSREWAVKGVFALIFYSRLVCLTPKLEPPPLARACPNGRSSLRAECTKSVWFPLGVGGRDWCESRKAFRIPVRLKWQRWQFIGISNSTSCIASWPRTNQMTCFQKFFFLLPI